MITSRYTILAEPTGTTVPGPAYLAEAGSDMDEAKSTVTYLAHHDPNGGTKFTIIDRKAPMTIDTIDQFSPHMTVATATWNDYRILIEVHRDARYVRAYRDGVQVDQTIVSGFAIHTAAENAVRAAID